ncbi:MAG: hypothetical protein IJC54_07030 [Clostridia bacterium]|nr:hypothetical protein [Clostridia bacterium]MBQ4086307.1 hypothetical protein [Clostridia bacterium]
MASVQYERSLWREKYERFDFVFEGRKAILVRPEKEKANGRWLLKTVYFDAFQDLEEALVSRGFHLAYLDNHNRWGTADDLDAKARFRDLLVQEFGLSEKCVPIGMSCGGLHAIKQAARYPDMVEMLYLDAPVVDQLSCPMGFGVGSGIAVSAQQEMLDALGLTRAQMIAYRDHPLDNIPKLIEKRIPLVLVWGDSDTIVPFEENGLHVKTAYEQTDIPALFIGKAGCDHHPHGPYDMQPVIDFIMNGGNAE